MANEILIRLTDDTTDRRYSQANTATYSVQSATTTKTQQATRSGSTPQEGATDVFRAVGGEIFKSTEVGKFYGKIKAQAATAVASPTAAALLALSIATELYKEWIKWRKLENEWINTVAIQSGANWQNVNMRNMRTSFITGRITGERQRYRR